MRSHIRLLCTLPCFFAADAYAGAWTQDPGKSQLIVTGLYYSADKNWNTQGKKQPQAKYRKYELNPYYEYGWREGLTFGTSLSLQHAHQKASSSSASQSSFGIGDSEFFMRKRLWQRERAVVSSESFIKLASPYSSDDQPQIGGKRPDIGTGFSAGYNFDAFGRNHFANLDTQYRYRFGRQKDQVKLAATTGLSVSDQWTLMPQAFFTWRVSSPNTVAFTQSSSDDYNQVRLQMSGIYKLRDDVSLQFGGFGDVSGKNAGVGRGVLLAVWKNL